tara:strand:+ start:13540 stop:14550 length:1011 start_codon:yes stop_codon:yes gene_type:complete
MKKALSFDDVLLRPQYSDILSRSEVDMSRSLKFLPSLELPIISSPMDTVTGESMACAVRRAGGIGIVHRYNTIEEQCKVVLNVTSLGYDVGAAIGVGKEHIERAINLAQNGVSFLCVDVAHGHHIAVKEMLLTLREKLGPAIHIMAGNVATLEAFNDLADWGANSIRVGIGGGSICSTRVQTGHGIPTLQSVLECAESDRDVALIADGGIRNSGDIVKALAAGADFVMIGSLLAGTDETPGEVLNTKEGKKKVYRGMASKEAQNAWRGRVSSIEGVSHVVPYRGPVEEVLHEMGVGIRSGISYSGARSIQELQTKSDFIQQTSAGAIESSTHIKAR